MKNIRQRINDVMKELNGIDLVEAKGLKFKIIQHDDVTSALRPLYLKHGIDQEVSVTESKQLDGGTTELLVAVAWVNIDDPTDRKVVNCVGHSTSFAKDGVLRRDDLGVGKALSYAVKMAQLKNFALLSGDDDIERTQARNDSAPRAAADDTEVETVMNALAAATTSAAFEAANELAARVQGRLTGQQKAILGQAWKAAKDRIAAGTAPAPLPPELQGEPREQTTAEKIQGIEGAGLPPLAMNEIKLIYSNVRTAKELSRARGTVSAVMNQLTPAQKQLLKEYDAAANKLLQMQQQAANP